MIGPAFLLSLGLFLLGGFLVFIGCAWFALASCRPQTYERYCREHGGPPLGDVTRIMSGLALIGLFLFACGVFIASGARP